MRTGSPCPVCAGTIDALMVADLPEWWGSRHSERMGTPQAALARCRLRIKEGFTVIDRQQRHLNDHAHTLGFTDLNSYLVARCQQDASLTRLAGELQTTIDVIRRLIDQAGIHCSSPKVRSARQRRRATDQRLTIRAEQLGFASLQAYLADHVARRAWTLGQIASELGVNRDTVRDRLHRYGLRPHQADAHQPADAGRSRPLWACNNLGAGGAHRGEQLLCHVRGHHRSLVVGRT
jgi:hypothetical protein